MVAAEAGRCTAVDVQVAEHRAHHVLQVKRLRVRVVFRQLHTRAVDLKIHEAAVGEMVLDVGAVELLVEARKRHRFAAVARIGEEKARGAGARANERDAALPDGGRIRDQVFTRRTVDDPRPAIARDFLPEPLDQRRERRLVVGAAVAEQAVLAGVAGVRAGVEAKDRHVHAGSTCKCYSRNYFAAAPVYASPAISCLASASSTSSGITRQTTTPKPTAMRT